MNTALVWFRQDLRLSDNPALSAALAECDTVIPLFIDEPEGNGGLLAAESRAGHVWLHHTLLVLDKRLQTKGSRLLIQRGAALPCLQALLPATGATHLYWNRRYDPAGIQRDTKIKQTLGEQFGCKVRSFNGSLLDEPWTVLKPDNTPYRVFTAFWKAKLKRGIDTRCLPEPERIPTPDQLPDSLAVDALGYLPAIRWDRPMMAHWEVGETAAQSTLSRFLEHGRDYQSQRDFPAQADTSRLSPHLHFGEASPRQIYYQAEAYLAGHPQADNGIRCFLSEVGWREFAYYLLYHFPETLSQPMDARFKQFIWRDNYADDLKRWQRGETGFPVIDAGMRELWATGWMHNRVRMIVASLLTKNLLIHWQEGEKWFRDTLLDADPAINTMGWQWVAGSGADAAPYFRIFNPVLQSEKFDPHGEYIRRWVPELADFSDKQIHQPYKYKAYIKNYPAPMVDLKASRVRALEHFAAIKSS